MRTWFSSRPPSRFHSVSRSVLKSLQHHHLTDCHSPEKSPANFPEVNNPPSTQSTIMVSCICPTKHIQVTSVYSYFPQSPNSQNWCSSSVSKQLKRASLRHPSHMKNPFAINYIRPPMSYTVPRCSKKSSEDRGHQAIPLPFSVGAHLFPAKKIVIIGVHGWALLGGALSDVQKQNSSKFCTMMSASIRRVLFTLREDSIHQLQDPEIFEIPLVGHGTVEIRVADYFENQIRPFLDILRDSDSVIFSSHSQGCIVTGLLLDRLLNSGFLSPLKQNICVLAIGGLGVHHGPFPDIPSDGYSATRELFALNRPEHELSRAYLESVTSLLNRGVKMFFAGSWFDQVVPLFSACAYGIEDGSSTDVPTFAFHHQPSNLFRGIFVQADLFEDGFLLSLARLCLHVRNLGRKSEVLVHLSGFVRGWLIQRREGAHSVIHSSPEVFLTAAQWFFAFRGQPTTVPFRLSLSAASKFGSFFQDAFVQSDLNRFLLQQNIHELIITATSLSLWKEINELKVAFQSWRPENKSLQQLQNALHPLFYSILVSKY